MSHDGLNRGLLSAQCAFSEKGAQGNGLCFLKGCGALYLFVEVIFFSEKRKHLPTDGYRPDAIFPASEKYRGITFIDLPAKQFDVPTPAFLKFSFEDGHYQEVVSGQSFKIMEGSCQVGEGKIISIEK